MINRKNLWFLTLFSLILVLGVYYITLPSEIFNAENTKTVNKHVDVNVSESDKKICKGDRICQGIFMKYLTVSDEVSIEKKRLGGFGSTNKL